MITFAMITKPGDRPVNEDSVGFIETSNGSCFVLCDGLGGHGMGDVASTLVKDRFLAMYNSTVLDKNFIEKAFAEAQNELINKQKEISAKDKMKTTAVCVTVDNKHVKAGYVGDSRLYVFSKGKIYLQTKDHSIPQMLVLTREISEDQIRNHPDRNMLLRVMGIKWDKPLCEILKPVSIRKCQAMLLCSDGFWELIDEKQMCSTLNTSSSVQDWLNRMTDIVVKCGKGKDMDNYSAIAIWNQ